MRYLPFYPELKAANPSSVPSAREPSSSGQGKLGRGGQASGEGRRLCQTPYAFSFDHLSRPAKEMVLIGVTDEETEAQVGDVTYWPGVRQSKDEFTPANSKPRVFASKHELSAQPHTV